MKRTAALLLVVVFTVLNSYSQALYMPRIIKSAYDKGTRSMDGRPGKNYFQNKSVHNIHVTVAPPSRTVTGSEDITYTNNSPDKLSKIVFRLELNSHTPTAVREREISKDYLSTGVIIDEFSENGKKKTFPDANGVTYKEIDLDKPIAAGGTAKFTFKWHYDVSVKSDREGTIDPTTYFIAYFYPRVAVYDDTSGFDTIDFREGHEFYNDFNDYNLEVTAPKNFIVWATGDLQNVDEVLQPKFADRLKNSFVTDDVVHVATLDELKSKSVTLQNDNLTWKWKASNITDVAFAVSDHFIWDAGSVVVDKATNRRASVQSAYNVEAKDFQKQVEFGKHTLDFASNNYPGTPYPFSKTTIVRGFADMEYPMMVNDSSQENLAFTRFIVEHEILHSWFPFYMGINERRYPFMDEGWTTAFEYIIGTEDLGKDVAGRLFQGFRVSNWINDPGIDADIPIITAGDALTGQGFGNNTYGKAALGYLALKDLLGDDAFKSSLHEFIARWNGKHPLPWDMFNSFNSASGKDLNWFFNGWFFSNGYIDLAVAGVKPAGDMTEVTIHNIGGYPAPTDVMVTYNDDSKETFHATPAIWEKDMRTAVVRLPTKKPVKSIVLDGGIYMDANPADNKWQ